MVINKKLRKSIILDLMNINVCNYCILRFLNEKNSDTYRSIDDHIKNLLNVEDDKHNSNEIEMLPDEKDQVSCSKGDNMLNEYTEIANRIEPSILNKTNSAPQKIIEENHQNNLDVKKRKLNLILMEKNDEINSEDINKRKKRNDPCSACLGLLQESESSNYTEAVVKSVNEGGYDSDDVTFALSLPISYLLRNRSIWLYLTDNYLNFYSDIYYIHEVKQDYLMVSVKEVWKWLSTEKLAAKLNKKANDGVNGNFHVNINVEYKEDKEETACLFKMYPKEFEYRSHHKRKFHGELLTRKKVESMLLETDIQTFRSNYPVPPEIPKSFAVFSSVECIHDSLFIAGRYNKLSRNLSQTPWMINGERRMESSVEEIIEKPLSELIPNSGIKFSSSGREDCDVRTLGKGRPFVVDISNPRRTKLDRKTLKNIEKIINNSTKDVIVRDLQVVQKEDLVHIKAGEETKTKTYTCYCLIKLDNGEETHELLEKLNNLSNIKNLVINQKTPIRVLHRRPLAVRPRTIHWLEAQFHEVKANNFFFKLKLKVGAGTYIKEFVHGDFGRTLPNLSEILGRETDILALDVEEVALQWPPSLSDVSDTEE